MWKSNSSSRSLLDDVRCPLHGWQFSLSASNVKYAYIKKLYLKPRMTTCSFLFSNWTPLRCPSTNALTRDIQGETQKDKNTKTHSKEQRNVSWMFYSLRCNAGNKNWADSGLAFSLGGISGSMWFSPIVKLEVTSLHLSSSVLLYHHFYGRQPIRQDVRAVSS